MMRWIGAAVLALPLVFAGTTSNVAAAAPLQGAVQQRTSDASDLGARRRTRHHQHYPRFTDRRRYGPYRPYYYDRPFYYAPAPFVPFNFGYGIGPWW
jgi:hypothetical protein